jgi:hypothetical protein
MNKKILAIFANHSNSYVKNIISLHNLSIIEKYVTDICIIDSENEEFSMKLNNNLKDKDKIINYFFIKNDTYYDFGKWVYGLNNIKSLNSYDYILFVNDSIIITPDIDKYFNYIDNFLESNINLFAYNDSTQLQYHYQSYFFIIKPFIAKELIKLFEERKPFIDSLQSLIENMEFSLTEIDNNHDCFIKIGIQFNHMQNIYWTNEDLYSYLLSINHFAILKYKRICDIYNEFNYLNTKKENIDYDFFKEYYNLTNLNNEELLKFYLNEGFDLGMKDSKSSINLLPNYYREKLLDMNILYFFDVPYDFDIYYYKEHNPDLKNLSIIDIITHYISSGIHENRFYNKNKYNNANYVNNFYKRLNIKINYLLPYDFNPIFYKNKYSDLHSLIDKQIVDHYLDYGIYENKIYKLPDDFTPENYKKYNKDLVSLNDNQLIDHYIIFGNNENRKYINTVEYEYKPTNNIYLPKDFYPLTYKKINYDLCNLNNDRLEKHYIINGFRENRYYKFPRDYENNGYKKYNKDLEKMNSSDLSIHFCKNGLCERRIYKVPDDFNSIIYKSLNKDLNKFNDEELVNHYINIGIHEKRYFRLNLYFNYDRYKELNPDLASLNNLELILHYIKNGVKERRKIVIL